MGITVISGWIIWFGAAAYDEKFAFLTPLDCITNCLAIWLMFNFSQKYWDFIEGNCCKCRVCRKCNCLRSGRSVGIEMEIHREMKGSELEKEIPVDSGDDTSAYEGNTNARAGQLERTVSE